MTDSADLTHDLQEKLEALKAEHRDLDVAIEQMIQIQIQDDLLIRRLKKRKLLLKDRISVIENLLDPDELA